MSRPALSGRFRSSSRRSNSRSARMRQSPVQTIREGQVVVGRGRAGEQPLHLLPVDDVVFHDQNSQSVCIGGIHCQFSVRLPQTRGASPACAAGPSAVTDRVARTRNIPLRSMGELSAKWRGVFGYGWATRAQALPGLPVANKAGDYRAGTHTALQGVFSGRKGPAEARRITADRRRTRRLRRCTRSSTVP